MSPEDDNNKPERRKFSIGSKVFIAPGTMDIGGRGPLDPNAAYEVMDLDVEADGTKILVIKDDNDEFRLVPESSAIGLN